MYKVYILKSETTAKYYIGHTENLENRLHKHNKGYVKSTKSGKPWDIIYIENFNTKQEAYRRELEIKSYKGGNEFKKIINKIKNYKF